MLHVNIALIDKTGTINAAGLATVAAAINTQVNRDLAQYWPVLATVSAIPEANGVPPGTWPVFIVPSIKDAGGFHLSKHNQPFAQVAVGPGWSIAASHETCEMLVDPSGNRLQPSVSIELAGETIRDGSGTFEYLVEVCDPSESPANGYAIGGVTVSDFYTPHFYEPKQVGGARYSFTGAIPGPRQVLPGGYLSWYDSQSDELQQLLWTTNKPEIKTIGKGNFGSSLRQFVDLKTKPTMSISATPAKDHALALGESRAKYNAKAAMSRMALYSLKAK
jgi:hypothetical protein